MEGYAGLVAGSHNRNELVVIRREGESAPKPVQQLSGLTCQICGDDVGLTVDGELFVACNECAFPICTTCYHYERSEGSQVCPHCKTRFKRLKGCARVAGDEEEDGVDDLENEFSFARTGSNKQDMQYIAESMLQGHMSYGRAGHFHMPHVVHSMPQVPLLINGLMVDDIPPEEHVLVPSFMGSGGKRIHPLPCSDPCLPVQPRSMDPSKDLAAYGYGSVAWKERLENWKQKQEKVELTGKENGGKDWDDNVDGPDLRF